MAGTGGGEVGVTVDFGSGTGRRKCRLRYKTRKTTAVVTPARAGASDSTSLALTRQSGVGKTSSVEFTLSVAVGPQTRTHLDLWLSRICCTSSCRGQTAAHTRPPPLLGQWRSATGLQFVPCTVAIEFDDLKSFHSAKESLP